MKRHVNHTLLIHQENNTYIPENYKSTTNNQTTKQINKQLNIFIDKYTFLLNTSQTILYLIQNQNIQPFPMLC